MNFQYVGSGSSGVVPPEQEVFYDWYYNSETDEQGVTIESYYSDIAGTTRKATGPIRIIAKSSLETVWKEYLFDEDSNIMTATGTTYAFNPILVEGDAKTAGIKSKINDIKKLIADKKKELLQLFYNKTGIDPSTLSSEDVKMLIAGIAKSTDDNLFFGGVSYVTGKSLSYPDNYYFLRGKLFADAAYTAAFIYATAATTAAAVQALMDSGAAAAMALALSPTVGGSAVSGAVALEELGRSAALAGVSYVFSKAGKRASENLKKSGTNLKNSAGHKVRQVENNILDLNENNLGNTVAGHTIEKHVSKDSSYLMNRVISEGVDATSFYSKSDAVKGFKELVYQKAKDIESFVKSAKDGEMQEFAITHKTITGYGYKRANYQHVTGLSQLRAVLLKDSAMATGYKILTFYPVMK